MSAELVRMLAFDSVLPVLLVQSGLQRVGVNWLVVISLLPSPPLTSLPSFPCYIYRLGVKLTRTPYQIKGGTPTCQPSSSQA